MDPADAAQLLALNAPYNDESTATGIITDGTLADYLISIGIDAGD